MGHRDIKSAAVALLVGIAFAIALPPPRNPPAHFLRYLAERDKAIAAIPFAKHNQGFFYDGLWRRIIRKIFSH
ncbi:hypothetical protein GGR55DRAFT_638376 [Xylaria sp. FL0064]|nr:hypothetical protein GGR55DRAFT_638376 [Xylaria sp. FL0064]